jgi:2',3'-cyclic-nucleotide 2'-phosphodiesterase (5'-nucleotidase family)
MTPLVVNGTTIVQAGIDSHKDVKTDNLYLGELSIVINRKTGDITSINHKLIPVDRTAPLEGDVKNIKEKYLMEENTILNEKLGSLSGSLTHDIKTPGDSSLGNMITDSIRYENKSDIAILDSNFFATSRKNPPPSLLPEGDVTMGDLVQTSLWMGKSLDASVETWNVQGDVIKKVLEDGVKKLLSSKNTEGLYQISGIKMSYDPKKPEGKRITEIFIGDKPLDEKKNYRLTTSYIQGNWNPLLEGRDEKTVEDGRKIRHIVADYIKDKAFAISNQQEGRIFCA